jgi:Metallo-peptidase family M12/Secretion system C-terminal sorting domain/Fibronectin type III domain
MSNKLFKKSILFGVLILSIMVQARANNSYWNDIPATSLNRISDGTKVYPDKYRSLSLNYEAFRAVLLTAKKANVENFSRTQSLSIEIPMPYGSFEKFNIIETPMMEEALANKYPSIKTFSGISVANPSTTIKMDIGPFGFHAMVLSSEGRYFIDPVSNYTTTQYMSYYRRDIPTWANTFTCGTIADEQFIEENKNRLEAYYQKGVSSAEVQMRNYRLALACTVEYSSAATGKANPTKEEVLAKMVISMNRVNGVYEKDVAVHMDLIANNDTLIFLPGNTDPYSNNDGGTMLQQNVTTVNNRIGIANYDIGHVFSTGGGGIAGLGVICTSSKARGVTGSPSPVGDAFDIDYVAHEMGHQFAGNHTFNSQTGSCAGGNRNGGTAWEPGSGTTIMAYAGICGADDIQPNSDPYFHSGSIDEINAFINSGSGNTCPVKVPSGNNPPVVDAGPNYTIPISTPFMLTGSATDPDGDVLTYSWEQMDLGPAGAPASTTGNSPLFRFFSPKATPVRSFPKLNDILTNTVVKGERLPNYARSMKFRLTARDNKLAGGATGKDEMTITVSAAAGPFNISSSNTIDTMYVGSDELVTWNVANTNASPINCSLVRILLSTDAGQNFNIILKDSTANDGSELITVPNNVSNTCRIKIEAIGNIFFDINNAAIRILAPAGPSFNIAAVNTTGTNVCPPDSVSFDVSFSAILGFNSPIVLSTTNLPAGAGVVFSKSSALPGEVVNMKVSTTGVSTGIKNFSVVGTSGSIVKNAAVSFTVVAPVTAGTTFSAPANGQINVNPNTPFTWATTANASGYRLQIASDSFFTSMVLDTNIIGAGSTSYIPNGLPSGTKLYTKINGFNACGNGPVSAFISFTTGVKPNAPSTLILLSQAATSATIKWTDNSSNETGFRVERSDNNDSTFVEVANNLGANTSIYISPNLVAGTTYYYRVRAVNGLGFSDYTNVLMVPFGVGINNNQSFAEMSVYPNPTDNLVNIKISDSYIGSTTVNVYDELGRLIISEKVDKTTEVLSTQIDLSEFSNGVYVLQIYSADKSSTQRIVKLK